MKLKMRALQSAAVGASIAMTSMTSHAVVMQDDAAKLNSDNQTTQSDSLQASAIQTRRIIVEYNNQLSTVQSSSMDPTESASIANSASLAAGTGLKHLRQMGTGAHVFIFDEKLDLKSFQAAVGKLAADPTIAKVSEDTMMQIMATPTDPDYNNQWHYFEPTGGLNLPDAWDQSTGEGVVVAVIDTGITDHSDLNANILPGYDMISDIDTANDGDGRDSDPSDAGDANELNECSTVFPFNQPRDSSWHGTHVAGTVAAVTNNNIGVAGVAYDAKVVPVRALGVCGGFTSDVADSIIWAAGGSVPGVPANQNPAQVINLSLGSGQPCPSVSQSAVDIAVGLGSTVVVAAGNASSNAANASPASCDGVVTVAAVGRNGGETFYTNFGDVVDVAGPGGDQSTGTSEGVLSTLNTGLDAPGTETYAYYQGTSMASPHVAGAVALMYAIDPDLTPAEAESLLKSTARSFPSTCTGCGVGIVDAAAAIDALSGGGSGGGGDQAPSIDISDISGATNQWEETTLEVPAGQSELTVQISGGTGDADLYVRRGANPTTTVFDCRPYIEGNSETCTFENPQEGTWFIRLRGFTNYSGVRLQAASQ